MIPIQKYFKVPKFFVVVKRTHIKVLIEGPKTKDVNGLVDLFEIGLSFRVKIQFEDFILFLFIVLRYKNIFKGTPINVLTNS